MRRACARAYRIAVMRRPAPSPIRPRSGVILPSRTAQIGTVLHSELTVRHQFLGGDGRGDGTPEIGVGIVIGAGTYALIANGW
jgi:hypothetical protein